MSRLSSSQLSLVEEELLRLGVDSQTCEEILKSVSHPPNELKNTALSATKYKRDWWTIIMRVGKPEPDPTPEPLDELTQRFREDHRRISQSLRDYSKQNVATAIAQSGLRLFLALPLTALLFFTLWKGQANLGYLFGGITILGFLKLSSYLMMFR